MINLPISYQNRMKELLKEEYPAYIDALAGSPVKAFRVNTDKISLSDFEKINPFSDKRVPFAENAFYFEGEKIGNHPFHHAGLVYSQEPAAMAPCECLDVKEDWTVLDMCAAPGGKSTQIKNKLSSKGVLVSNEIVPSRCKILTGNIERLGLQNVITTCLDSKRLASLFARRFDLVIVDAPCSGEGMFRKEEIAVNEWSEENVQNCQMRQAEILDNAVLCLKNSGYIIYATCTFSLEENEKTIDAFLKRHPEFSLVKPTDRVLEHTVPGICFDGSETQNIEYTRRFYPHKSLGEGQFMAVLRNNLSPEPIISQKVSCKVPNIVYDFLDEVLVQYDRDHVLMNGDVPVYFTPDFCIPQKCAFSLGVTIGEIKKNYILPHHQFFTAMGKSFKNRLELTLDDNRLLQYIHGDEISGDIPNGWASVNLCGCSIGGAKAVSGRLKNHYPKGLRAKF